MPAAVLEERLGDRSGHPEVLRQRRRDLMVKAVEAHTDCPWVLLYVKRWLAAPLQQPDGTLRSEIGGPRKGRRSRPCWRTCSCTTRSMPGWPGSSRPSRSNAMPTTRWCTATAEHQAEQVLAAIADRMVEVGLRLHPDKTRIVYCKDGDRRGSHEHTSFTFLGYTFRPARARNKNGKVFTSFFPAISKDALKKMGRRCAAGGCIGAPITTFDDLARMINPIVRGWMNYYGRFYRSALIPSWRASTPT